MSSVGVEINVKGEARSQEKGRSSVANGEKERLMRGINPYLLSELSTFDFHSARALGEEE